MNVLNIEDDSLELANTILDDIKASEDLGLLRCVQCGMCTSICPGARNSDYNPRDMLERVLEGDETILDDESIWNCFYCYTCHSICPVGNSACEVNQIIKQLAISKDKVHDKLLPFVGFGDSFLDLGIGGIPSNFFDDLKRDIGPEWWDFKMHLDDVREELGLGSVYMPKESIDEVSNLLINSGFEKRLNNIKDKGTKKLED